MIIDLTTSGNEQRAIVIFAGWAMDSAPFRGLRRDGYDVFIVSHYHDTLLKTEVLRGYREVIVIGWSMGVLYGEDFIRSNPGLPITKTIAINGSPVPRDDTKGIPVSIYEATRQIATDRQLDKFYRRVCGGESNERSLMKERPSRHAAESIDELDQITSFASCMVHDLGVWDEIVLSRNDRIFPIDNLLNAWQSESDRITVDEESSHLPDFQKILDRFLVDKNLVGERFSAASATYSDNASVQREAALRVSEKIGEQNGIRLLEIGSGAGLLTKEYQRQVSDSEITTIDLAPQMLASENGNVIKSLEGDAETAVMAIDDCSFDMVVSSSTMQWFNSPRRFLKEVARILKPGGTAILSTYGASTFSAVRNIAPGAGLHHSPIETDFFKRLNVSGNVESERKILHFDSAHEALRHIRLTGVNATSRKPLPVGMTKRLLSEMTNDDGGADLDFEVVYFTFTK